MGGCCCSVRKPHIQRTPVYCYYPRALEANEALTSHNGPASASAFAAGLLVDFNINTATPDTFCSPPAPLPYDVLLGCGSPHLEFPRKSSANSFDSLAICEHLDESDFKTKTSPRIVSPRKSDVTKLKEIDVSPTEEEDACPICLEEYDTENPEVLTKCKHHFHLSCIMEWMERSDTCPMCDQETDLDHAFN